MNREFDKLLFAMGMQLPSLRTAVVDGPSGEPWVHLSCSRSVATNPQYLLIDCELAPLALEAKEILELKDNGTHTFRHCASRMTVAEANPKGMKVHLILPDCSRLRLNWVKKELCRATNLKVVKFHCPEKPPKRGTLLWIPPTDTSEQFIH